MSNIIHIVRTNMEGSAVNAVNARELWEQLESKRDFSTWIKARIEKFDFVEGEDYIRLHKKVEANNATLVEYIVTLDMAKELAMVENNKKGREVRKFFIECEKEMRKIRNQIGLAEREILKQFAPRGGLLEENKNGMLRTKPIRGYYRVDKTTEHSMLLQRKYELQKYLNGLIQEDIQLEIDMVDMKMQRLAMQ